MSQFDFVGLTRINVVILPINIDDGDFLRYSNIIKRYPSVNLCDTARPRTRWKAGRVAFSYHLYRADQPVPPVTTLSTSSSSSSPTPSGTDNNSNSNNSYVGNLFWSQRVIAVMGVARCGGTAADVTALYSAFNAAAAAYPSAICKTLFVVDPPAAQFALDSRENIVFGYSEDAKLMETIVQSHLVAGTAQAILIAYEHDVYSSTSASTASDPSPTTSPTPSSSSSFSSSFPSSTPYAPLPPSAVPSVITTGIDYSRRGDAKQRGKRGHRQQKRRGDLALQAGQWDLALSMYAQAADDARGAGDWEWAGAALEGQCAALIAKAGLPRNAKACEDDVMRRAAEALALYAKRVAVLEGEGSGALAALCRAVWAELALYVRVARFKATIAGAKEAAAEWLTNAHACGAKAFADLPLERARLWGALAAVYREIGFRRKFAFYAWLAAGALTEASRGDRSDREMAAVAHRVLEDAGRELGLGLLLGRTHDRGFAGHKKANFWGGIAVPFTFGGWEALQVPALVELIGLARQMGDHRLTAAYSMYALANYTAALPQEAQEDLALEVIKAAATAGHPVDVSGVVLPVPSVLKINPIPATGNYTLVPPKVASSGPFIYTPTVLKANKRYEETIPEITWVDSEPCKVDVLVSNPLDVEIRVTKIQFRTTGPRLICDDVCFDVAPASKRNVVLECTVEGEGEMLILGCHTEALGVTAYTPVHRNGRSYTQNEFYADPVAASGSVGADPPSSSSSSSSSSTQQEGRKVTVIGKMPLIDLRVRTSQLGAKHYLYEHEMYRHQLDITNVGTRPIRHFVPTLQYEQGDRCEILDWSEERCLPLLPEQSIPITIAVSPRLASNVSGSGSGSSSHSPQPKKPIQLMISYGEDSAGYTRSYALQFSYSVAPSISVDRVDVHGSALGEEHFTLVVGLSNRSAATLAVGVAGGPGSSGENRPWKVATPAERAAEVAPNESSAIVLDFERLVPPEEFEDVLYSYLDVPQPPSHPPPPIPNTSLSSSFHRKKGVATLTRLSNLARVASSASLAAAAAAAATAAANNNKDNVVIVSCKDICKGKDKDKDKAAVHISKLCEWVKEKAFKGLALRWRSTESAKGEVSLDDPPLTLRMIRQICIAPVVVEILCDGRRVVGDVGAAQPRTAETLHTMEVVVRNRRASRPIAGPLLVVLTVASQHGDTLPKDLFAVVGPMQAWVSELGPGMVASLKTKFIIMSPGSFTFTAVFLGEKDHQYIASTSAKIVFEGLKKQN